MTACGTDDDRPIRDVKDATGLWHRGYAARCGVHDWWGDLRDHQSTCVVDLDRHRREMQGSAA